MATIAKIQSCIIEDFTFTPILVEVSISVNVKESQFSGCSVSGNGGIIRAYSQCRNIQLTKVCAENCSARGEGQFLFVTLEKSLYGVIIENSIFSKTKAKGIYGMRFVTKQNEIIETNLSHIDGSTHSVFFFDHTNKGSSISYSVIADNKCTSDSIICFQEIDTSNDKYSIQYVNILRNRDHGSFSIIFNEFNTKTVFEKCNIHENDGRGFLFRIASLKNFHLVSSSIQKTFGESPDRICNKETIISSLPSVEFNVNLPEMGSCYKKQMIAKTILISQFKWHNILLMSLRFLVYCLAGLG